MASDQHNLSDYNNEQMPHAGAFHFGIIVSDYNGDITAALQKGCMDTLLSHGAQPGQVNVIAVPGAFELTAGAALLLKNGRYDAVICLGCVIKGETDHDRYINQAVAQGITQLTVQTGVPVIFGLLTPNNREQALDRAGGKRGNKGVEAAVAAIRMAAIRRGLS